MQILPQNTFIVSGMYDVSLSGYPLTPTPGDTYICSVGSGSWVSNRVYTYDNASGNAWVEYQPKAGNIVHRLSDTTELYYDGTNWVEFAGSSAAGSGGLWSQDANGIYRNSNVTVGATWCSSDYNLSIPTGTFSSQLYMSNGNFGAMKIYCKDMWNVIDYDPHHDINEFAFDCHGNRNLVIKSNGYVNIGDSGGPGEKLQITEGNIRLFRDDGDPPYINFYEGDIGAYWTIGAEYDNDRAFRIGYNTNLNSPMFEVHPNASGRISGSFSVGKLTPPNYPLDVDGTQIGLNGTAVISYLANTLIYGDRDGSGFDTRIFSDSSFIRMDIGGTDYIRMSSNNIRFNDSYTFPSNDGASGQLLITDGTGDLFWGDGSRGIIEKCGITIDGGGGIIPSGVKGDSYIPYDCEIERVILTATPSGSIYIDIWKDTTNNFPPTQSDSIVGTSLIKVSSNSTTNIISSNNTLSGWTTSIADGDILRYYVSACTTIDRCSLTMRLRRT